jgi:predicted phage tail protein
MPFLVCDEPSSTENVKYYMVKGIALDPLRVEASPETTEGFKLDISQLAPGSYTVKAMACNDFQCSIDSAPFTFAVPGPPTPPAGLRVFFGR